MKKLTALLVSLAMVFTVLPMAAIAEGDEDAAVPEAAEEISEESFGYGGFEGPEMFDESLTNPGVEIDGDAEQDEIEEENPEEETAPETDEEAPSESETEEPAEEPEVDEPTEAATEPEVEPDNGVSDEEVEAFKEYVYSLGETELEEANVIELFLALQIIDENSEMTYEEYYQAVIDAGIDKMSDLVEKAIEWKILDLRQNDPDWIVQSDTGIEGPEFEGMPQKISEAEKIALFQLMAIGAKTFFIRLTDKNGDTVADLGLEVATSPSGAFNATEWASEPSGNSLSNKYNKATLESIYDASAGTKLIVKLTGKASSKYQISEVSFGSVPGSITVVKEKNQITIDGQDLLDSLYGYDVGNPVLGIIVTPKTVTVSVKEEKNGITDDSAKYTIEGLQKSTTNQAGNTYGPTVAANLQNLSAYDGETFHFSVSSNYSSLIDSVKVKGPQNAAETPLPINGGDYTIKCGDETGPDLTVTITVTYKTKAELKDVRVTGSVDSFTDGITSVLVTGTSSLPSSNDQSGSVSKTANSEEELKDTIAKFLEGDTITLTVKPITPESGTYRLKEFDASGTGATRGSTQGNVVSGVTLGTGMTFTFTFETVKDAPILTVTASTGNLDSGNVTFTVKNYAEKYQDDITTAHIDAHCNTHSSGSTAVPKDENVNIGKDGTFGVYFTPKNHAARFNFNYEYTVTGTITYDDKPITKSADISIGEAA